MNQMHHQKLINEKNELQRQIVLAERKIKELIRSLAGYNQLFEEIKLNEGKTRRTERLNVAKGNTERTLGQFRPYGSISAHYGMSPVEVGLHAAGRNPRFGPMSDAIGAERTKLQNRVTNIDTALDTARASITRSLDRRAVRGAVRQANQGEVTTYGGNDTQLRRVSAAKNLGMGSDLPGESSAETNLNMAKSGVLGKRVGKRVERSALTRTARAAGVAAGQREMAKKAKALGVPAGEYMKQQAAARKSPQAKIGFAAPTAEQAAQIATQKPW